MHDTMAVWQKTNTYDLGATLICLQKGGEMTSYVA